MSVLPASCKVFEKLVLHQVTGFIKELTLFAESMPGYRKGQSTVTARLGIRDDIVRCMTLMVQADYSKAFDTINFKSVQ